MNDRPAETVKPHSRLVKCTLEVEAARAFWAYAGHGQPFTSRQAFDEFWFGARSLSRVEVLLTNLRARFCQYPAALTTLHQWPEMDPDDRRVICHWHMQLSDPLYRAFSGTFLVDRHTSARATVTRDLALAWVKEHASTGWNMGTRILYASKLLTTAHAAGLLTSNKDPRPLKFPRVSDLALTYLLYLLRDITFEGSLLANPYLASVGLADPGHLEDRLRKLSALHFRRQAGLLDFGWKYAGLEDWGASMTAPALVGVGGLP